MANNIKRIEIRLDLNKKSERKIAEFLDQKAGTNAGFIKTLLSDYVNHQGQYIKYSLDQANEYKKPLENASSNHKNKKIPPKRNQSFLDKNSLSLNDFE